MAVSKEKTTGILLDSPEAFFNRELSWLEFAGRVIELVQDPEVPLLERVKFAGIVGMLHDEFFMKRISGLKRQVRHRVEKLSIDGRTPSEELEACRARIRVQCEELAKVVSEEIRPGLAEHGIGIVDYHDLTEEQREELRAYFTRAVLPILTPLAVDKEHPFPFISNMGVNLAVTLREKKRERFVRIKMPANRKRWVRVGNGQFVPLEQVIAANLDLLFPKGKFKVDFFRVTRGAEGERNSRQSVDDSDAPTWPGSIISRVTDELKARRFAGHLA